MEGNLKPVIWLIIIVLYVAKTYYERRRKAQKNAVENREIKDIITSVTTKSATTDTVEDPYNFLTETDQMIEKGSVEYIYDRPNVTNHEQQRDYIHDSQNHYYTAPNSTTAAASSATQNNSHYISDLQQNNAFTTPTQRNDMSPECGKLLNTRPELNIAEIDWRKAVLYLEILKPKF